MPVAINFKICDNASECSGRAVCPAKAIEWDEGNKTLAVHNDKCINCGICEKACKVNAIRVARNQEELAKILDEYKKDPRSQKDLFVDRYGAMPLRADFMTNSKDFGQEIENYPRLLILEVFKDDTIECLLKSIPKKELIGKEVGRYRKIKIEDDKGEEILRKYGIRVLPALVFFRRGKMVGKVEGYYGIEGKLE